MLSKMSKWGKVLFITTLLWQIPCIIWIFVFKKPSDSYILSFPSSVFTFGLLYLINIIVWGWWLAIKYLEGDGTPINEVKG